MSNVSKVKNPKPIPIMLDKQRTLFYDMNAYAELEEIYGSVDDALQALQKGSIKAVRAILWAGLLHELMDENGNYTLTPTQVGKWITINDLERISECITRALYDTMPDVEQALDQENQGNM